MKLALTGGPSGGKTTLAMTLQKEMGAQVIVVPEAASLIFSGGFPRRPGRKNIERRQKAIFYVQRELEGLMEDDHPGSLLVCDRGSLDGLAYWPSPDTCFLSSVETSLEKEIRRYDWVIHLDTAPSHFYDLTNPIRTESFEEAWKLNEKVKSVWALHPRRFVINNHGHFVDKLHRALMVVTEILAGKSYAEIHEKLAERQAPLTGESGLMGVSSDPNAEANLKIQ